MKNAAFEELETKVEKEIIEFREQMSKEPSGIVYNNHEKIMFYERMYTLLTSRYAEETMKMAIMDWLSKKEKPIRFLYEEHIYGIYNPINYNLVRLMDWVIEVFCCLEYKKF